MADKNLILGARLAAGGFNTGLADAVDKSIARATENIASIYEAQAKANAEIDRRAFAILDKFPPEINFAKLPPAEREALQTWATTKKEQYFKKAQELAKMRVNSPDFLTTQNELNAIKQAYINANDNLLKAQALRTTYSTDRSGDGETPFSKSMHDENIGFVEYDEVFLPESPTGKGYSVTYDDFGNPTYAVGDKSFTLDEVDFNYRDKKALSIFDALSRNTQNLGAKGVQFKENTVEYNEAVTNIDLALESNNSIKSILNDNIFSFLNLTPEQIASYKQDLPKARQELKSKLLFHLGQVNKNTYAGYLSKLNAQNNNNNPYSAGDLFDLDAAKGTVKDAITFINSRPDVNAIKRIIGQTDLEGSAKYATGAEIIKRFGEKGAAGVGINKEDSNKLYYAAVDGQGGTTYRPIPLDQNDQGALFDFYMNAYNVSPEVSAIYKNRLNLGTFTPVDNNTNPLANPINLSNEELEMTMDYINTLGDNLKNVNRTGTPRTDEELITEF
tara:strand:+ start:758 stop:2266 length:1509 start_codon:yes stop_codon:yes gene_type:complete